LIRREKMENTKVSLKQSMDRNEAVGLLEDLVTSLKAGKIVVEQGKEFVSMNPTDKVDVVVEAKQKKQKGELTITLSWRIAEDEKEKVPLKISSKEPEPEVMEEESEEEAMSVQRETTLEDDEHKKKHSKGDSKKAA
jgi:amphi-Trp domain-containing protein